MSNFQIAISYFALALLNAAMFILWMVRPDIYYLDKHRYCAVVSFQLSATNLICAFMFAFFNQSYIGGDLNEKILEDNVLSVHNLSYYGVFTG